MYRSGVHKPYFVEALLTSDVLCRRKSEVQALAGSLPQLFETFEGITVLDFHRENCGPCKILGEEVTVRITSQYLHMHPVHPCMILSGLNVNTSFLLRLSVKDRCFAIKWYCHRCF
jgi:hypothetical protein